MKNLIRDLKVGDKVVRRDVNEGRVAHLGGVHVVEHVGRTNLKIEGDRRNYDRETGRAKDAYGHTSLMTVEYAAYQTEVTKASHYLRGVGLEVRMGYDVDDRLVEIAAAVKAVLES